MNTKAAMSHRDPYATVRDRLQRHVGVAVDRVGGADEHRVVHLAERYRDPARVTSIG
jgi:hypothetical protein